MCPHRLAWVSMALRRTKTPTGEMTPALPSMSMGDGAHGAIRGLVADTDSSIPHLCLGAEALRTPEADRPAAESTTPRFLDL